jgi:very-short-patch-repair endonuclease
MGALLQPARGTSKQNYLSVRNRFSQKMVDFVAEDRASGAILALIELDDRSHNPIKDIMRDRMTASAGYRTIRLPSGRLNQAEIASRLQPLIPAAPRPTLPPQMMPR